MAWQEFLKGEGSHNFHIVFKCFFFQQKLFAADSETKEARGGSGPGACSPRKIFENLHAVMAILVLFE